MSRCFTARCKLHPRCWWPLVLAAALGGCERTPPALLGYIEAEAVYVAPAVAGRLARLAVERGDRVQSGQRLFALEPEAAVAAVIEAAARLAEARARSADLESGQRPDELAVIDAELLAAQARARQSAAEWVRQRDLGARGLAAATALDNARAQRDADAAAVAQLEARARAARLAGREAARAAAEAASVAAAAQLAQRQWTLDQQTRDAPVAGRIEERYYREGEWVPAGGPVVSLLPPEGIKVRFWIPEPRLAGYAPGSRVRLDCDGCASGMTATLTFIASTAEFTPPVIYSKDHRAQLVFLAEARPDADVAERLRPGQPVEVRLP